MSRTTIVKVWKQPKCSNSHHMNKEDVIYILDTCDKCFHITYVTYHVLYYHNNIYVIHSTYILCVCDMLSI